MLDDGGVWVDFGRLFATDPTTQVTPFWGFLAKHNE